MSRRLSLLLSFGLMIVVCEAGSYGALALLNETWDVPGVTTAQERAVWQEESPPRISLLAGDELVPHLIDKNALHPYLGYARIPADARLTGGDRESLTPYGFGINAGELVRGRQPGLVVVGLFGGSVAENFLYDSEAKKRLADAITRMPQFVGKEVVFSAAALGGYKQPQQFLALSYLYSLGAHFDVVITLDGFNDIAVTPAENVPKNVNPLYPRGWYFLSEERNGVFGARVDRIVTLRTLRVRLAQAAHWRPFKWSFTERLLWTFVDALLARRVGTLTEEVVLAKATPTLFDVTGPRMRDTSSGAVIRALTDTWVEGSIQMEHLSRSNGALYFHFLQPNQYVSGSKPMSPAEELIAFAPSIYATNARVGYPFLRAAAARLRSRGVLFQDLTQVFAEHPEPLYVDSCCHFSPAGSRILADAMGAFIVEKRGR